MSSNHMPPMLGAILADHDQGPEYTLVECVGDDFACTTSERVEGSAGMTDAEITTVLTERGWSVGPTLCPDHRAEGEGTP